MTTQAIGSGEILVRETVPSSDTVRERFGMIDGLRAIAIIAVMAYEVVRLVPALTGGRAVLAMAAFNASQGFTLFLLLSGFTLGYPAIVAFAENGRAYLDVGRFAVKRILRIYPAYLLALVLTLIIPPLALRYGLPRFTDGVTPFSTAAVLHNLFFAGDGLGNDGFRALGIVARCYLAFPLLLLLWSRSGRMVAAVILLAAILDATTGAHALGIGALVPFVLGIVAADVRAQTLPAFRFGLPLALLAGAAAIVYGPALAAHAALHAEAGALRIDPFWSFALFGLVVAVGALPPLERVLSFPPLRLLGAASFAISLVVVPVSSLAIRQLTQTLGPIAAAASALLATLIVGFILWQLVDRVFGEESLRRRAAANAGPLLDAVLARIHADRVVIGRARAVIEPELAPAPPQLETAFYAPPPRSESAELAIVSQRSGSPEELAEEILTTKKRLAERSAAIFAEPIPPVAPIPYEKPGFYRKVPLKALESQTTAHDTALPVAVYAPHAPAHDAAAPAPAAISAPRLKVVTAGESKAIKMRIGATYEATDVATMANPRESVDA